MILVANQQEQTSPPEPSVMEKRVVQRLRSAVLEPGLGSVVRLDWRNIESGGEVSSIRDK
jgi:hypothetical protein